MLSVVNCQTTSLEMLHSEDSKRVVADLEHIEQSGNMIWEEIVARDSDRAMSGEIISEEDSRKTSVKTAHDVSAVVEDIEQSLEGDGMFHSDSEGESNFPGQTGEDVYSVMDIGIIPDVFEQASNGAPPSAPDLLAVGLEEGKSLLLDIPSGPSEIRSATGGLPKRKQPAVQAFGVSEIQTLPELQGAGVVAELIKQIARMRS